MRAFEFHELLLWDRAKRFGVSSREWQAVLNRVRRLNRPRTSKQERDWILSVLNEIRDPNLRLRCLREFLSGRKGPGKRPSPKRLELASRVFYAIEEIRQNERLGVEDATEKLQREPRRYGFNPNVRGSKPMSFKALEKADEYFRKFWGIRRKRLSPQLVKKGPQAGKPAGRPFGS